jgi:predicted DNA-binding transcriptional regulator AlpA
MKKKMAPGEGMTSLRIVRVEMPGSAADVQSLQKTGPAPRRPAESFGDQDNSQSDARGASGIVRVLGRGLPQPRKTFDEVIDALQLLTVTDVCKLLRISKPTLWRLRRSGNFPDPTTVTERIFGWRRREIDEWLASRPSSRRY